ncbi:MAG: glycosyltransferase [Bacteroidetes bacterium]|nr:glycosyltransferase [Bacteroidota bacterium]
MSKEAELSFVICTYNRSRYLDESLSSLLEGSSPRKPVEVLVIDNNSPDETPEVVRRHQQKNRIQNIRIRYVKERNQGLSHARNRGIREASAPVIVFVDDDIRASKTYINSWIHFFEECPHAKAAGGKIHVQFDDPRPRWMSHFLLPLLGHHDFGDQIKRYSSSNYPFGGNMALKREIFEEVGCFNTNLGRKEDSLNAGEEKELFSRLKDHGIDFYYLPDALLYHRVGAKRLTVDYIKNQALGLGQSMKLRLEDESGWPFTKAWIVEAGKLLASVPLGLFYIIKLEPSKSLMLLKFRFWIWRGYFGYNSQ